MSEGLDRLAALAGIEESYRDLPGEIHRTSAESKRAFLTAMGFDVGSRVALEQAAADLAGASWRRPLGPVHVARGGDAVPVHLARNGAPSRLRWELLREDGSVTGGDARREDLPVTGLGDFDGRPVEQLRLEIGDPPPGYHRLRVEYGAVTDETRLIVAPRRAWRPRWLEAGERKWGWACQLYGLRSRGNWGIGDFSDLARLASVAPGADAVGLSPLHAVFSGAGEDHSPYAPVSREFLNWQYLDVTAVEEFATCAAARDLLATPAFAARLAAARDSPLLDYPGVADLKRRILVLLYAEFDDRHPADPADERRAAFDGFRARMGAPLHNHAVFQALMEHFGGRPWRDWPEACRRPDTGDVATFAAAHAGRVGFHVWLQWQADRQLGAAAAAQTRAGQVVGLYRDLAVGSHLDGSDTWGAPELFPTGVEIGAPPDQFSAAGQRWGVPPLHPLRLRALAYEPWARLLRANMAHAGALRVDHVMGLQRLFWVNRSEPGANGTYVRYPFEDLLGVLALESHRNRCLIIGEDLGTVPEAFRERMNTEGVLSTRVLQFERHESGLFRRPEIYPAAALAISGTHDLPPLRGFWEGRDLETRAKLGRFAAESERVAAWSERDAARRMLLAALKDQGLLPEGVSGDGPLPDAALAALIVAVERFLARTPSALMLVNLDDAAGEREQANVPGTSTETPNWRRRMSRSLESLAGDPLLRALVAAVEVERGGGTGRR